MPEISGVCGYENGLSAGTGPWDLGLYAPKGGTLGDTLVHQSEKQAGSAHRP